MTATPDSTASPGADSAPRGWRGLRWESSRAGGAVLAEKASDALERDRVARLDPDRLAVWVRASRLGRVLRASGLERGIRRVQQADARHPVVVDSVLAAALMLMGTPHMLLDSRNHRAILWIVHITMLLPLVFRRRAPFAVFTVGALGAGLEYLAGTPLPMPNLGLLVALYTVASRSPLGKALAAGAITEFGAWLAAHGWGGRAIELQVFVLLSGMAVAAAGLGLNTRTRRAYLASLEERARQLELERDQQAQIAAAAERASIAREVHDIVTHSLSVMVALTDGASFAVHTAPDRAAEAIGKAAEVGRQAIGDMQRVLGVLRGTGSATAGPALQPQPGLHQLDDLLAEVRAAGLPVELVVSGALPGLSTGAELAVYRVVQEALTNTRKHAGPGASARVELRFTDAAVDLAVVDGGGAWSPAAARPGGGGHGIAGMRERLAGFGGSVTAGPNESGRGWRVQARLPIAAAEPTVRDGSTTAVSLSPTTVPEASA